MVNHDSRKEVTEMAMMQSAEGVKATVEMVRRIQLRRLDMLLAELEALNLRDVQAVPDRLALRLRDVGVGHPSGATITEVIDLVFRAQERYLTPLPTGRSSRSSAA